MWFHTRSIRSSSVRTSFYPLPFGLSGQARRKFSCRFISPDVPRIMEDNQVLKVAIAFVAGAAAAALVLDTVRESYRHAAPAATPAIPAASATQIREVSVHCPLLDNYGATLAWAALP